MSVHKPSQQHKPTLDGRVYELINAIFPEFKCTITDIKFPKKDFVVQLYCYILDQLTINAPKAMTKPIENQLQGNAHSELYNEALQLINLSKLIQSVLSRLQNRDALQFGLEDLIEPKSTRNSVYMFTLLNFFNFADSRMSELKGKVGVVGERRVEMDKLLEKREKLSREQNQAALCKAKKLDIIKEIKVKKVEVEELKKDSNTLEHMSEKKQNELEDVKRHSERIQMEKAELKKQYQKLEAQQVQSPDAINNTYKHLQEKLKDVQMQLEQAQETAMEKKKAIKIFDMGSKDCDIRLALLTDIVREAKAVKELNEEQSELKVKIKAELDEIETHQAQLTGLKQEVIQLTAVLTNLQLQHEKTRGSMRETIRHLQQESKTLECQQSSEMQNTLEAINEMQTEVNELIEENNRYNNCCEKLYAELNQKEQSFIAMKAAEIDSCISDLEYARKNKEF